MASFRTNLVHASEEFVAQDARPRSNGNLRLATAEPRQFPVAATSPRLPAMIPDEILDYYGWLFCQGGFRNLEMTFEQFLAVVAAVNPAALNRKFDLSDDVRY